MTNTVLLISDEHNPFYSSPYGHPSVQTPSMERLAADGTLFQNAYCPSPLCTPCRSAFLSGKWPHQIQMYSNCNLKVDPSPATYGGVLAEQVAGHFRWDRDATGILSLRLDLPAAG